MKITTARYIQKVCDKLDYVDSQVEKRNKRLDMLKDRMHGVTAKQLTHITTLNKQLYTRSVQNILDRLDSDKRRLKELQISAIMDELVAISAQIECLKNKQYELEEDGITIRKFWDRIENTKRLFANFEKRCEKLSNKNK